MLAHQLAALAMRQGSVPFARSAPRALCKAAHRVYRPGPSREWLKTKCSAVGKFVITGFRDLTPGEIEAVTASDEVPFLLPRVPVSALARAEHMRGREHEIEANRLCAGYRPPLAGSDEPDVHKIQP